GYGASYAGHPANNLAAGCGNAGGCIIRQWLSLKSTRIRSGTIGASVTVAFCCARADCDPMVSISAAPPPTVGIRRSSTLPSFHKQEIEELVVALSGTKLSVRESDTPAH